MSAESGGRLVVGRPARSRRSSGRLRGGLGEGERSMRRRFASFSKSKSASRARRWGTLSAGMYVSMYAGARSSTGESGRSYRLFCLDGGEGARSAYALEDAYRRDGEPSRVGGGGERGPVTRKGQEGKVKIGKVRRCTVTRRRESRK